MLFSLWRVAGLLFAIGGLLSAVGAALFAGQGLEVGSLLTLVGIVFEGAALILLGVGFRPSRLPSWAPWLFVAAGGLLILLAPLAATGMATRAVTILIGISILVLIAAGAVATTAARAARRSLYVTLAALALFQLINAVSAAPVTLGLVGVVYVVLGVLLLSGTRPVPRT